MKSYLFIPECKQNVISLHKPECQEYKKVKGRRFVQVKLDLGTFTRCGFYDWKLVRLQKDGTIRSVYKIADLTITKYKEEGEGEDPEANES